MRTSKSTSQLLLILYKIMPIINNRRIEEFEDCPGYGRDASTGTILATDRKALENFKKRSKAQNKVTEMNLEINILRDRIEKLITKSN